MTPECGMDQAHCPFLSKWSTCGRGQRNSGEKACGCLPSLVSGPLTAQLWPTADSSSPIFLGPLSEKIHVDILLLRLDLHWATTLVDASGEDSLYNAVFVFTSKETENMPQTTPNSSFAFLMYTPLCPQIGLFRLKSERLISSTGTKHCLWNHEREEKHLEA